MLEVTHRKTIQYQKFEQRSSNFGCSPEVITPSFKGTTNAHAQIYKLETK